MLMPSASATVSRRVDGAPGAPGAAAQQVDAEEQVDGRGGRAARNTRHGRSLSLKSAEARRIDEDAGREAALGLVFAAEIDDDEMQRQRADREIEPAQPQRRQAEHERRARIPVTRGRGQRDPERRAEFRVHRIPRRECAGGEQSRMAERDLPGVAGEQHQRQGADRGEENLAGEIERKGRREERKCRKRSAANAARLCARRASATARGPARSRCGNSRWRAAQA